MRLHALEIGGIDVRYVPARRRKTSVLGVRARLHRRNELARDLCGLEVARKRLCETALDERRARTLDALEDAHRRTKRAT